MAGAGFQRLSELEKNQLLFCNRMASQWLTILQVGGAQRIYSAAVWMCARTWAI